MKPAIHLMIASVSTKANDITIDGNITILILAKVNIVIGNETVTNEKDERYEVTDYSECLTIAPNSLKIPLK